MCLVDPWRIMHPDDRDYTYFSHVHQTYSRIDCFMIQHKDIPLVSSSQIDYISLSDHAPIHMTLSLDTELRSPPTWKLNESLMQIPEVRSEVGRTLTNYFLENVDPLMSPMIVWQAHKCVLRGELIRIGP